MGGLSRRVMVLMLTLALILPSALGGCSKAKDKQETAVPTEGAKVTEAATKDKLTARVSEDFESKMNIAIARSAKLVVKEEDGVNGSKALFVSGRSENWQGVSFDISGFVGQTIETSVQVKNEGSNMKLSIQIGEGDAAIYNQVAQGKTGGDDYVTLSGTYDVPSGTVPIYLYVESDDTKDFYIDNFMVFAANPAQKLIQEGITPLKEVMAKDSAIAGRMGVAVPASALLDEARMNLVTKHFSSVTCENEMKPESILGSTPNLDKDGNPILNFDKADKIMEYILGYNKAHPEDVIRVRGHVLVWHSQTPSWFFKENYSDQGAYVSKDEMLKRMDYYIKNVMEHFEGADSKYKGLIYAWDVVNEQIDNGGLRQSDGNGGISNWYQVFRGDDIYVKEAFRLANKYAPSSVKLFYNDYGETDLTKSIAICKLLREIKDYAGARIDGMGMQGHYDMSSPTVDAFEKAVRAYSAVVGEIQITELDMQSSTDYDGSDPEAEYTKEAYRYKALFDKMYELDKEDGIDITAVTMWGTNDGVSWLQSSSAVGGGADGSRKQCPLLFDDNYHAKPAYYAIVDPSKLEPFTNNILALYSSDENWSVIPEVTYKGDGAQISFKTIWNEKGMKVQVKVTTNIGSGDDKAIVYVDEADTRSESAKIMQYTLKRTNAISSGDGYIGVIDVPLSDIQVGKTIAFDLAVINNGTTLSWNDLTNNQASTSKFYGELTLKPYAAFQYGTSVIDGKLDDIWKQQSELPLNIKVGSPKATGKVRAMWDEKYLYVYAEITDDKISKASSNAWEQDSLEIFLDQNNAKATAYEDDDCQYRINFDNEATFNGKKCVAKNLKSATKLTDNGYVVEAAVKWTDIKPAKGTLIGVDFQINDDTGNGSRAGTYNWYDKTGTGYMNPSVFGTATLFK